MVIPSPFSSPVFRADLPVYPELLQLIRVTSGTIPGPLSMSAAAGSWNTGSSALGSVLYIAFTEQLVPDTLQARDREPCLVISMNSVLVPGFYLGRLAGSWTSLPVYEVTDRSGLSMGPEGPQGEPGVEGPQGSGGPQGLQGEIGPPGPAGSHGGPPGPPGPAGSTGAQGDPGPAGSTGSPGTQGTQGLQGVPGATGSTGNPGTQGTTGAIGAVGSTGNPGTQGSQGIPGPTGATGATGSTGNPGTQGTTGPQGSHGQPGTQGTTGATGSTGNPGTPGPTGSTGNPGTQGTIGPPGPPGPAGSAGSGGGTTGTNSTSTATAATLTSSYADLLTVILPSAGVYLVIGDVSATLASTSPTNGDEITAKLRDTTNSLDVSNTTTVCYFQGLAGLVASSTDHGSSSQHCVLTVTGTTTIAVQAKYATILPPSQAEASQVRLSYIKLA